MEKCIGIYPGTFDPVTNGHLEIMRRGANIVDKLIVGVAEDVQKNTFFTPEERVSFVENDIKTFPDCKQKKIEIVSFKGLLVDFAKSQKATLIIRGLRAVSDFEYEFQMSCMNARLCPDIETVFLTASETTQFMSSRFVKEICRLGGDISTLVSKNTHKHLKSYFKRQK